MTEAARLPTQAATGAQFGPGEHVIVWSARRIMAQPDGNYTRLVLECLEACGPDSAEVFATVYRFVAVLTCASRRQLQFGPPGCPALTPDERQFLTLIAASQAGSSANFRAYLQWFACGELREDLAVATHSLAIALKLNGFALSIPASIGPMICERDAA